MGPQHGMGVTHSGHTPRCTCALEETVLGARLPGKTRVWDMTRSLSAPLLGSEPLATEPMRAHASAAEVDRSPCGRAELCTLRCPLALRSNPEDIVAFSSIEQPCQSVSLETAHMYRKVHAHAKFDHTVGRAGQPPCATGRKGLFQAARSSGRGIPKPGLEWFISCELPCGPSTLS